MYYSQVIGLEDAGWHKPIFILLSSRLNLKQPRKTMDSQNKSLKTLRSSVTSNTQQKRNSLNLLTKEFI